MKHSFSMSRFKTMKISPSVFSPKTIKRELSIKDINSKTMSLLSSPKIVKQKRLTPKSNDIKSISSFVHSSSTTTITKEANSSKSKKKQKIFFKNNINCKEREIIKKTASFYLPNASLLSSFLELDPNKYIEKPKEDKSKIRIQKLMDKTLHNIIPKTVRYNLSVNSNNLLNFSKTSRGFSERRIYLKNTSILMRNEKKNNYLHNLLSINSKIKNKTLNNLVKLKTIKWLWNHKSIIIEKLFLCYQHYKWFLDQNEYISKAKFIEFLAMTEIGNDNEFVENLFYIFKRQNEINKNNDTIMINECLLFLVFTSNYSYERKLNLLLDILSNGNNTIIPSKILQMLKLLIFEPEDYTYCKNTIKYSGFKMEQLYEKKDVFLCLIDNGRFQKILNSYYVLFYNIDKRLEDELSSAFNFNLKSSQTNLLKTSSMTNGAFSIYSFTKLKNIIDIEEKYQTMRYHQQKKCRFLENKKISEESNNTKENNEY